MHIYVFLQFRWSSKNPFARWLWTSITGKVSRFPSMPVEMRCMIAQVLMGVCNIRTISFITGNIFVVVRSDHMINKTSMRGFNCMLAADSSAMNICFVLRLPMK